MCLMTNLAVAIASLIFEENSCFDTRILNSSDGSDGSYHFKDYKHGIWCLAIGY